MAIFLLIPSNVQLMKQACWNRNEKNVTSGFFMEQRFRDNNGAKIHEKRLIDQIFPKQRYTSEDLDHHEY